MARKIVWTRKAQKERKTILEYWKIRNQSSVYSANLHQLIKKAVVLIPAHPHIGCQIFIHLYGTTEETRMKFPTRYDNPSSHCVF